MTDIKEAQGLEVVAWQDAENPLYTTGEKRQMHGWATDGYPIVELVRKSDALAVVEKLKQDSRNYLHEVEALKARIVWLECEAKCEAPSPDGWIPVSERLPEGTVLASYTNNYNKSRIIRAKYVQKFTQESEDIDDFDAQYDEETDTYYDCEGWYEVIDNWGSYSSVAVTEGTVTHWMNLPAAPEVKP